MNLLRQQILARTTFAENQNRGIRRRHAVSNLECPPHLRSASQHLPKLSLGRQPPPQRIVFSLQDRQLQQIRHPLTQLFQLKSFHQIIRGSQLQRLHCGLGGIERRYHQHRHFAALLTHPTQKGDAVLPRHDYVQQHQVGLFSRQSLARRLGRLCLRNAIFRFQRATQSVSRSGLVVNN